jgi:enamine deaminase RidA (YjgF/YER057c/UK114 family)
MDLLQFSPNLMKRPALIAVFLGVALAFARLPAEAQKKQTKEEREVTQTLELPKDPPTAVIAETGRLVFRVSPLSSKGLLSQQVRDALRWLLRASRGAAIVKLRAFVAGSGDVRRVQAIVSETFTDRRLPLPALSVVQVGGLPLDGAQVIVESIAVNRKVVNPHGLAFFSGQPASVEEPLRPSAPLVEKSLARLAGALRAAGVETPDVLRATCYLSSLEDVITVRQRVAKEFPHAAVTLLQRQRAPVRSVVECEAVARLRTAPSEPLSFLNPPGLVEDGVSQVALVAGPRVALSGTQLAFGYTEADARLAFQRLGKSLEEVGASMEKVAVSNIYPLSRPIADLASKVRSEYFDKTRPPAGTMLAFEGLPSLDAAFGVDVVAVLPAR